MQLSEQDIRYLLGNNAIALAIHECNTDVVAGYPGTPSSEIIEYLAGMKPKGHVEWSVNEKVAMEVAIGASWTGARSVVTMKHVGLNVASDPFMTLAYTGVKGGMVVISADDPGCHSSQNEQDTRRYAAFAQVPCLDPATPQEAYDMIAFAFEFSEMFETPVVFRPTTRICHGKSGIRLQTSTPAKHDIGFEKIPLRWVMLPVHARVRHRVLIDKQDEMAAALENSQWNRLDMVESARLGIIASGVASVYVKEAIDRLGVKASCLKIGAYPAPAGLISELAGSVDTILVIEELEPVVEELVRVITGGMDVEIHGKDVIPRYGELNPGIVEPVIAKVSGMDYIAYQAQGTGIELPGRPPVMCPGCPHRGSYYAMKKAFGKDAIFPGDIGCYTLGVQMGTMDTCLCMGASITVSAGIYHAGETKPICCSIGDSTFLHTGIPGLLNAVYNGADITVTILDNRTTAMTGHQPNPGTGLTVLGDATYMVSLEGMARACGVELVLTTDPFDIPTSIDIFKQAKEHKGTSVVISKQECIITARRRGVRLAPFYVDRDECRGCKACIRFGCPAIEFDQPDVKGEKGHSRIGNLCVGCGVCAQVCPFNAIGEVET
ncbi:MAG: indolepyruvate ferredoxin oxidoreductase subunit alpha [ANME-2 cluster archaeon]|nr:indolepyruvate ferredoxin oxidoreductase subunit alpha [ANME-2 cluster archaeon]